MRMLSRMYMAGTFWRLGAGLVCCASLWACAQTKPAGPAVNSAQSQSSSQSGAASGSTHNEAFVKEPKSAQESRSDGVRVDGTEAMQYVRQIVGFGPRYLGSTGHKKTEEFLRSHLKSDHLEEDVFSAETPVGDLPMRNFIAKFPGSKDGVIVIAGHYDTLYGRKDFVGANDGGSSTGLPLALADKLRSQKKREGYSVWIVWLDGEEAIKQWTPTDSIYGARHLAEKWKNDGTAAKIRGFVLLDMVGDSDLNIDHDQNSTPWLEDLVFRAASELGYQSHFFARNIAVSDDHEAFAKIGVPVADLIDFDYGYGNVFWHTPQDSLDKLSAQSLAIVGDVTLETVRLIGERK